MAYNKKIWVDRLVEHPGRFLYELVNGQQNTVDTTRAEGAVAHEGDAFDAANMNDFEQRVAQGFTEAQENLEEVEAKAGENLANAKAELNTTIEAARTEAIETANAYASERVNTAEAQIYDSLNSTSAMLTGHIQEAKDMAVQQAGEYTDAQVQEALSGMSAGDMQKAVYDTNSNGKVDIAEKAENSDMLAGQPASHYATASALGTHAASQSNPHGVTAGQAGAYTKAETDSLLANKANVGWVSKNDLVTLHGDISNGIYVETYDNMVFGIFQVGFSDGTILQTNTTHVATLPLGLRPGAFRNIGVCSIEPVNSQNYMYGSMAYVTANAEGKIFVQIPQGIEAKLLIGSFWFFIGI